MLDPKAARERAQAATLGPWHYEAGEFNAEPATDELGSIVSEDEWVVAAIIEGAGSHEGPNWDIEPQANADFIAHARSDLPAALEALEEAQGKAAKWDKLLAELNEVGSGQLTALEHDKPALSDRCYCLVHDCVDAILGESE